MSKNNYNLYITMILKTSLFGYEAIHAATPTKHYSQKSTTWRADERSNCHVNICRSSLITIEAVFIVLYGNHFSQKFKVFLILFFLDICHFFAGSTQKLISENTNNPTISKTISYSNSLTFHLAWRTWIIFSFDF